MSVTVHRADVDMPDDAPWAILPYEWEDGEDNHLGYGPITGNEEAAHRVAAAKIPGHSYTLIRLIPVT